MCVCVGPQCIDDQSLCEGRGGGGVTVNVLRIPLDISKKNGGGGGGENM